MPNWITNYVEIKGDRAKIDALMAASLKHDDESGEYEFDFNGVIPMPEELNIESGSKSNLGGAAFIQKEFDRYKQYPWFTDRFAGVETMEQLQSRLAEVEPETLEIGRRVASNVEKYGCPDWYEWNINNWGTKWNANETIVTHCSEGRLVLQFETAWSPPEGIFNKLVADGFEVNCMCQDEDQSNYGEYGDPWNVFQRNMEYEFLG